MKTISIANDIVPIAEFKAGISQWFKSIQKAGHPLIYNTERKARWSSALSWRLR